VVEYKVKLLGGPSDGAEILIDRPSLCVVVPFFRHAGMWPFGDIGEADRAVYDYARTDAAGYRVYLYKRTEYVAS
jgi:hypothetical protein